MIFDKIVTFGARQERISWTRDSFGSLCECSEPSEFFGVYFMLEEVWSCKFTESFIDNTARRFGDFSTFQQRKS